MYDTVRACIYLALVSMFQTYLEQILDSKPEAFGLADKSCLG